MISVTRDAGGPGYTAEKAKQQRDELRQKLKTMQQQHKQFRQNLDNEQRSMIQDRLRAMQQHQERINSRLLEMGS